MLLFFDIGGTNTRLILSDGQMLIGQPKIFSTEKNFESGYPVLLSQIKQLVNGQPLEKIVGGIAGSLDKDRTHLIYAGNLTGWVNQALKQKLSEDLGCPVFLENDAALGALGEAHFGAGKNFEDILFVTVGTGVGGSHVVGGRLDPKAFGFEPGRDIFTSNSSAVLGSLISGRALQEKYHVTAAHEIKDEAVWDGAAKILALGLGEILQRWSPQVIVLGGALITAGFGIDIEKVETDFKHLKDANSPKILAGKLGDASVLYGALALSKQL